VKEGFDSVLLEKKKKKKKKKTRMEQISTSIAFGAFDPSLYVQFDTMLATPERAYHSI